MELLAEILAILVAVLAGVLFYLAVASFRRFGERRFLFVGLAFLTIALMGVLAFLSESEITGNQFVDETFAIEPAPLILLMVALVLVYIGLVDGRRPSPDPDRGDD